MSDLAALTRACADVPAQADTERIAVGPTVHYAGTPHPASDGTIALAHGNGLVLIIRTDDIRSVRQVEGYFVVEVPKGASVLVRHDRLLAAGGSADSGGAARTGSCSCAGGGKVATIEARRDAATGLPTGIIIESMTVCDLKTVCLWFPLVGVMCFHYTDNCEYFPGPV